MIAWGVAFVADDRIEVSMATRRDSRSYGAFHPRASRDPAATGV